MHTCVCRFVLLVGTATACGRDGQAGPPDHGLPHLQADERHVHAQGQPEENQEGGRWILRVLGLVETIVSTMAMCLAVVL